MRYWPISVVRTSPLLPGPCAVELNIMYATRRLSPYTFEMCGAVADHTEAVNMDGLAIVDNEEMQTISFTYAKRPPMEQWERMERGAVVERSRHYYVLMVHALQ